MANDNKTLYASSVTKFLFPLIAFIHISRKIFKRNETFLYNLHVTKIKIKIVSRRVLNTERERERERERREGGYRF